MNLRISYVPGFGVVVWDGSEDIALFFGRPKHSNDPQAVQRAKLFMDALQKSELGQIERKIMARPVRKRLGGRLI